MKVVDITNMPKKIHNKFIDKTKEDRSLICFSEFALFPNGIHFVSHILFNRKTIQFDIDISDRLLIKRLQNIVDCENLNECKICFDNKRDGIRCVNCFARICSDCYDKLFKFPDFEEFVRKVSEDDY